MGYREVKLGTDNSSINDRSVQGRTRVESLQRGERVGGALRTKKAWEEEEHLRTLRDVRDLLARGPPAVVAAAYEETDDEDIEEKWREREGRLRQRETLQKFSNWICEDRASKMVGSGSVNCKDFGSFVGSSSRGSNGSEMCKKIYERERERCKVTNGTMVNHTPLPPQSNDKSGPTTVCKNRRTDYDLNHQFCT